jgi:hypothetical protein
MDAVRHVKRADPGTLASRAEPAFAVSFAVD